MNEIISEFLKIRFYNSCRTTFISRQEKNNVSGPRNGDGAAVGHSGTKDREGGRNHSAQANRKI